MIDMMNAVNPTAASVGNHEFDFGAAIFEERLRASVFPWLISNIGLANGTDFSSIKRSVRVNIPFTNSTGSSTSSKFCFFGVAYDVRASLSEEVSQISYEDMISAAQAAVANLKADGCNVLVALTHQFTPADCELANAAR